MQGYKIQKTVRGHFFGKKKKRSSFENFRRTLNVVLEAPKFSHRRRCCHHRHFGSPSAESLPYDTTVGGHLHVPADKG